MTWKNADGDNLKPPLRPKNPGGGGYGTKGRNIRLITNHLEVTVKNKNLQLVHYDVKITHRVVDKIPKWKKKYIFEKMKASFPLVFNDNQPLAYDSECNAYSVGIIPQLKKKQIYKVEVSFDKLSPASLKITEEPCGAVASAPPPVESTPASTGKKGKKKKEKQSDPLAAGSRNEYSILIEKVNEASLADLMDGLKSSGTIGMSSTPFQMIEVMFRHYRSTKYLQVGRNSFFSLEEEYARNCELGGGKVGMTGFFASLRPAEWKNGSFLLNVDKAHAVFYKKQSIMEFMKETYGIQDFSKPIDRRLLYPLKGDLCKIKIRTTYNKRTWKVNGVSPTGADRTMFDIEEDGVKKKVSVAAYFKSRYGVILRYPGLNCLHVGNPQRNIHVPIEVCELVEGQRVTKKLTDVETAAFIKSTAVPPVQRLAYIKDAVKHNEFNNDPHLKALTFSISDQPLRTNGRVLDAPYLTMDRNTFRPRDGVWDVRGKYFHSPGRLECWAVLNYDNRTYEGAVQKFFSFLATMGREKNMVVNDPVCINNRPRNPMEDFKFLKGKYPQLQLICCVIPSGDFGKRRYSEIKNAGDIETSIISQCVVGKNVQKAAAPTISNILLKINAKLGGINNIVAPKDLIVFSEPFLIMGADVNHPPAKGDKSMPSIAAVLGSYDQHATKWQVEVRAQLHRVEIIEDLTEITMNILRNFYKQTKRKPNRIIMYRDGVSESQFYEVLSKEMLKMREACTKLEKGYRPAITFICVQKRHHTRLFCENPKDAVGRAGNVPPGTVLDRDVTHPSEKDFYLCSHQGIQGTSRPTHYHILWDDSDLPMDELQSLTYSLCHVYSRCTRSVSIPAPAYYAHLAAFRAKTYVSDMFDDSASSVSDGQFTINQSLIKEKTRVATDKEISKKLYYV